MTVSIIIAAKTWQKSLEECVGRCLELDFSDYEIIILPDYHIERELDGHIRVVPTGPITPPQKRDISIEHARGEILAFIDDDAYPRADWLKNALENFKDDAVAAVGGPAVTPSGDTLRQRASGNIYSSFLVSGQYVYRYLPRERLELDDYPTCNLLVRKSIMQALGGFNTHFWPGEDTKLCLDITKRLGKKIIYDPDVLVYHHRRPIFLPHLKQVASYALHRGYFVRRYPDTSLKISYFIPSIFLLFLFTGAILSFFLSPIRAVYLAILSCYALLVFIFNIFQETLLIFLVFFGTILTHLTYGFYFLIGLFTKKLKEEL